MVVVDIGVLQEGGATGHGEAAVGAGDIIVDDAVSEYEKAREGG